VTAMDFDYSIHYEASHSRDPDAIEAEVEARRLVFAPIVSDLEHRNALDLGCGTGLSVAALRRLEIDAVGVERDPQLAAVCRARDLPVVETDDLVGALAAHADDLGLVVLFDVLEHVPHDEQLPLLRAIRAAVVPGGMLLVKVPNASSPVASHRRYGDWTHTSSFTVGSLEFLLHNAGFDEISVRMPSVARRPPVRLWRPEVRAAFVRWIVVKAWQGVLRAQLPSELGARNLPPITADFVCVARVAAER